MGAIIWEKDGSVPPPAPRKRYTVRVWWTGTPIEYDYSWRWRAKMQAWSWAASGYRAQVVDNRPTLGTY
jgi:hypothetical protein